MEAATVTVYVLMEDLDHQGEVLLGVYTSAERAMAAGDKAEADLCVHATGVDGAEYPLGLWRRPRRGDWYKDTP